MSPGDRDFLCQPTQRSYRQPPWLFLQTLVPPACFRLADVLWYVAPARSTTSCPRSVRLLYVLEASVRASSSKSDIGNNFPSLMLIMALMKRSSGSKYNAHSAPSTRSRQTCISSSWIQHLGLCVRNTASCMSNIAPGLTFSLPLSSGTSP